jgi:hypothetical protein
MLLKWRESGCFQVRAMTVCYPASPALRRLELENLLSDLPEEVMVWGTPDEIRLYGKPCRLVPVEAGFHESMICFYHLNKKEY